MVVKGIKYLLINFAACGIMGLILFNINILLAVHHLSESDNLYYLFIAAVYIMGIVINSLIYYLTFFRKKQIKKSAIRLIVMYITGAVISIITIATGQLFNAYLFFRFGY